ncbi:hypothetical protein [Rhizobium sp. MHM7A]|uniref:hypothetical protein n=1 Tax=Rhizobium sp. MHM7A TaxID=2583233 RepID=UPI00110589FC|nr:hypothetical protein [Rhizobium sp. MHM7A]TLX16807.1 hypothetical protein FFR93_05535 [Rhizobium sp. MHM7A]
MPALASFDIFDTLICRGVEHPVDIFRIMEISHPDKVPTGFADLRERSERKSRRLTSREDVTLDQIYEVLSMELTGEFKASVIKEIEVETELLFSLPRKDGIARLERLRNDGYRVIGISDMYLPKAVIAAMLAKNGIVLDELYVSSELGVTKATGNMYRQVAVLEDQPLSWTHHGDNYRSDVANAIALGLRAIHTPITDFPLYHKGNKPVGMTEGVVTALVRHLMYDRGRDVSERTWFQIGAQHTGPLSILLCHLVRQTADRTGARNIFFLARDGYVLKRVYEILFPNDARKLSYLAASRRMINFPLTTDEAGILKFVGSDAVGMTGRQLLARVQVSVRADDAEADVVLKTDSQIARYAQTYMTAILEQAQLERGYVERYLRDEGLLSNDESVIVDVGWLCSMQKNLTRLLSERGLKGVLHGVYFGTNVHPGPGLNIEGLFYTGLSATSAVKAVASQVEVMELLFASAEQSIVTVLPDDEGAFEFVRLGNDSELTRMQAASKIIEGAVAFAELTKALGLENYLSSPDAKQAALVAFKKLCRQPSMDVAVCASSINHAVGFGGSRHTALAPAAFGGRSLYKLLLDYSESYWRGAMRRMVSPQERLILLPLNETTLRWMWYLLWRLPKPVKSLMKNSVRRVLNRLRAA